jgi:hypothetical protein
MTELSVGPARATRTATPVKHTAAEINRLRSLDIAPAKWSIEDLRSHF